MPFSKRLNKNIDVSDEDSFYEINVINYLEFSFFSLRKLNFLLIKIKLNPRINPEKKNAKKGLTNLM